MTDRSPASAPATGTQATRDDGAVAPTLPPSVPQRHAPRLTALGRRALAAAGWRIEGNLPDERAMVIVVAPHTSNWDFAVGVATMLALDLDPRWLGKHSLFRPPIDRLLRAIGGIPVRRDVREGVVEQAVAAFAREPRLVLALAPEGTRGKVTTWKSGYYAIAEAAGVPIVPAWIDWSRRVVGFGAPVAAQGGAEAMTARLRALFRPEMARRPEMF